VMIKIPQPNSRISISVMPRRRPLNAAAMMPISPF
jgi:hypothetical protein